MTYQDNNVQRISVFPVLFTTIIDLGFTKLDPLIRRVNTGELATAYTSVHRPNWTIWFDFRHFRIFGMSVFGFIGICDIWGCLGFH